MTTVYITAPREAADDLASFLVQERLAAGVNLVDCRSTYRWDDELFETDPESILFAKTTADKYEELENRLREEHPYDVPCIECFEEAGVLNAYADWIEMEVSSPEERE